MPSFTDDPVLRGGHWAGDLAGDPPLPPSNLYRNQRLRNVKLVRDDLGVGVGGRAAPTSPQPFDRRDADVSIGGHAEKRGSPWPHLAGRVSNILDSVTTLKRRDQDDRLVSIV